MVGGMSNTATTARPSWVRPNPGLREKNAELVCREEESIPDFAIGRLTWRMLDRNTLAVSTGEVFGWVNGSGWVRPNGSRADGRAS